jgi:hypothetical protein
VAVAGGAKSASHPGMVPMTPSTTPSLVGPSGAVRKERERLAVTLARVSELCRALASGAGHVDPGTLLSQLRVDLELHFALEESDAYFGAVLRERPSLSQDVGALRKEHAALLEQLDGLRAMLGEGADAARLRSPTLALLEAFRVHEHREGSLLQELVLRDDGVGAD